MVVDVSAQPEQTELPPPDAPKKPRWHFVLWGLVVLPGLLALGEAYRSPRLNFADYWSIVARVTTPEGGLRTGELWMLHNDHPSVLVSIAFWANARFFGGTNYGLGFACVGLTAIMLVAMISMLPRHLTGVRRIVVASGLSVLLFSSTATEYFGIGMSGMHWLLGIVPAVVALAFAHRGWTWPAVLFAVLASLGHGAGFPVWIALALVAWLRRDARWRQILPVVLGLVTFVIWLLPARPPGFAAPMLLGVDTYLGSGLAMLGQIWAGKALDLAFVGGALMVGLFVVLATGSVKQRLADDAGWLGAALLSVLVALMIGLSRGKYGAMDGLSPRYAMVALVGAAALLVLSVIRWPKLKVVPVVLVVALATYAVGNAQAGAVREKYPTQPFLAVAMLVDAKGQMARMQATPNVLPVLKSLRLYPFTDDFTLGCQGPELGDKVDLSKAAPLALPKHGEGFTSGAVEVGPVGGDALISGWASINGNAADCVLIVDQNGEVVGGGAVGIPRGDIMQFTHATGRAGWIAVAKPGTKDGAVLVVSRGAMYKVAELPS